MPVYHVPPRCERRVLREAVRPREIPAREYVASDIRMRGDGRRALAEALQARDILPSERIRQDGDGGGDRDHGRDHRGRIQRGIRGCSIEPRPGGEDIQQDSDDDKARPSTLETMGRRQEGHHASRDGRAHHGIPEQGGRIGGMASERRGIRRDACIPRQQGMGLRAQGPEGSEQSARDRDNDGCGCPRGLPLGYAREGHGRPWHVHILARAGR